MEKSNYNMKKDAIKRPVLLVTIIEIYFYFRVSLHHSCQLCEVADVTTIDAPKLIPSPDAVSAVIEVVVVDVFELFDDFKHFLARDFENTVIVIAALEYTKNDTADIPTFAPIGYFEVIVISLSPFFVEDGRTGR
jgi:hypothetical protein